MYKEYNEKGKRYFIFTGELETVLNEIVQFIKDQNVYFDTLWLKADKTLSEHAYNKIINIYKKCNYIIFNIRQSLVDPERSIISTYQIGKVNDEIYQNYMNNYNMSLFKQYENILNLKL